MKKITAIILAVVVFIGGFGAGNAYRSICKAEAVTQDSTQISAEVKKSNSATQLTDFDIIEQYPELPTGCEITAMTMELC